LQQPSWLTPSPASEVGDAAPIKQTPYPAISVRTPPRTMENGQPVPLPKPMAAPTFGMRQADPFEADDVEGAVISDGGAGAPAHRPQPPMPIKPQASASPNLPTAAPIVPPVVREPNPMPMALSSPAATSPKECYDQAEQAAANAQSADELADVVKLCDQGLVAAPPRDLAARLRSLAAWARNRHGELESDAGNDAEALADFNAAVQLDPNCWLAIHNRAVSLAQQGHGTEALRDFDQVLKLSPGMAIAYRNRGELLASMGRTREAVADYTKAIEQLPNEADLYEIRGHALHRLGRYQEALADLDHAIALAPRDSNTLTHRGNVYAELGDFERALADFHQALDLNANCTDAYRSLAWLESTCPDPQYRDPQQAVEAAERAAKLAPQGDCFVLDALAAAYAGAGDFDRAVHIQKQAMAVAPKSFSSQFAERLALYQQHRPYRNQIAKAAGDANVRAASLETPAAQAR
jgi:tetratricopeptide (TPR) repeat protein